MFKSLAPLLFILVSLAMEGQGQEAGNTLQVERQSFDLYQAAKWKDLLKFARKVRKEGFDTYYMRYRQGIALYELKRFRQSVSLLQKVCKESPDDQVAAEYLYYAYLLGGRTEDARVLALEFDPGLKRKLDLDEEVNLVGSAGLEYKHFLIDDFTDREAVPSGTLEQKVRKKLNYFSFSLSHPTNSRFSLFHAFSFLWGLNRVYDPSLDANEFDENLRQFQYYLTGNWHLAPGFDLTAGFHYVRTTLEGINPGYNPGAVPGQRQARYLFVSHDNAMVGLLRMSKSIHNFKFRVSGVISGLNGRSQYQPTAGMDYYPLGDTRLYLSGDAGYLIAPEEERYTPGLFVKGRLGLRIAGMLWIEPFGQLGKVSNYADEDAFIIYNSNDVINQWYGTRLNVFLAGYRLNIYYIYQQYRNNNFFKVAGVPDEAGYNVSTHLIGLRWRP